MQYVVIKKMDNLCRKIVRNGWQSENPKQSLCQGVKFKAGNNKNVQVW